MVSRGKLGAQTGPMMLMMLGFGGLQGACGLEHGQPAQRTMSKVIFDGFPRVFDPFCSQSSQNGIPIS